MKTKIVICYLLILGFIGIFIHSCSDDFLTKNKNGYLVEVPIYIHPDTGMEPYPIVWKNAGNASFKIVSKPDWFQVESMTGQFQNGIAILTCYVVKNDFFTNSPYFYHITTIPIDVDGVGRCFVNINYVNAGTAPVFTGEPSFWCGWYEGDLLVSESINFGRNETKRDINIRNFGLGYLIWEVLEYPEWISMVRIREDNGIPDQLMNAVTPNCQSTITTTCNRSGLPVGIHVGSIVIKTNDKKQPTYTITVQCQVGD